MSRRDPEPLVPIVGAVQRLVLAARLSGSGDEALAEWGGWIDRATAAGLGRVEALLGVKARRFELTAWDPDWASVDRVGALLARTGTPDRELARWYLLAAQLRRAEAHAAWIAEDDDGFEGGWAVRGELGLADVLGGFAATRGASRVAAVAGLLGLDAVVEARRVVNPGGEATTLALACGTDALGVWTRTLAEVTGGRPTAGTDGLCARASDEPQLILRAGQSGLTAVGLRVPIGDSTALAAGLAVAGASAVDDERLALLVATLGVERPAWVELVRGAGGERLRVGCAPRS